MGGQDGDRSLDHYARLVCRLLRVPTSTVSVVGPHRQLFAGAAGLSEPYETSRETPLSHSFCRYVVSDGKPLAVSDARAHPWLAGHPAIADLDVVAYLGWPLVDSMGHPVGSLCAIDSEPREWTDDDLAVLRDLSLACAVELQQSHHTIAESENLARTIFSSVDVAMVFYDLQQRLVLANDLAHRIAGAAGFTLDSPPFAGPDVRGPDGVAPVPEEDQLIPRALRGERVGSEMHWVGSPGRQVAMIGNWREVRHSDGSRWGTLVVAYDVTRMARSLQVMDEFIATVSHELRTPLTSIRGYLEVLADELIDPPTLVTDALAVIDRNAHNLQTRIGELLDAGDRGRQMETTLTDICRLAHRVGDTFAEQAKAADIELVVHQGAHGLWAVVDADRVEQAMENLVSNALKYTGACGRVALRVEPDEAAVRVSVVDTGCGMTEDEAEQAFDHFWRADATRRAAVPGLGIGLTLVRSIVDSHGGTVDLVSHPGRGTTVSFTLPHGPR